jgi:hypothetical protein
LIRRPKFYRRRDVNSLNLVPRTRRITGTFNDFNFAGYFHIANRLQQYQAARQSQAIFLPEGKFFMSLRG